MRPADYGREGLHRFRYHTGVPIRPLDPEERCPVLFRDIGLDGMALFLSGRMRQLGGPMAPIAWLRTEGWQEPYVDHGRIGRLALLAPMELRTWRTALPHVYVCPHDALPTAVAVLPGGAPDAARAAQIQGCTSAEELREALGGVAYDDEVADTRERVASLTASLARTEPALEPLRRALQSGDRQRRERVQRLGLTEDDLCTAWHHLPVQRREWVEEVARCLA